MDVFDGMQERDLIAPMVRAGDHTHTPVTFINIIQRNPSRYLTRFWCKNWPVRRILMPHIDTPDFGGFVLDLVVPDAHLCCCCQLANFFHNDRVVNESVIGRTRLPNINDLPDGTLFLATKIDDVHGLRDIGFLIIINNAGQF